MRALSFVGCVRHMEETPGMLREPCTLVGTSAGALVAFMMALRMTAAEMETWIGERLEAEGVHRLDVDGVFDLYDTMGIDRGLRLMGFLRAMLHAKLGVYDIEFPELERRTGRRLVVCASNLTRARPEYFGTPDCAVKKVSVLTALRASTSIPVLFTPVVLEGMMFVDGGLFENLPCGAVAACGADDDKKTTRDDTRAADADADVDADADDDADANDADANDAGDDDAGDDDVSPPLSSVLVLTVSWKLVPELPTDIGQFAWCLVAAMLYRTNRIETLNAEARARGWKVVEVDADRSARTKNDDHTSSSICGTDPFLGFCIDSLEFDFSASDVHAHVARGYQALRAACPRRRR